MIERLSIIVPCYNEVRTIATIYARLQALDVGKEKELIIVDDGSTDGSERYLAHEARQRHAGTTILFHPRNRGKGACIRSALSYVTGDYAIIQDADLEYDPKQIPSLAAYAEENALGAVYGSRNGGIANPVSSRVFSFGVAALTAAFNILYGQTLTDIETCYKLVRTDLLKRMRLTENRFGIEIEISAKIARAGLRIGEVPIRYVPRRFEEGKKIKARDGVWAFYLLVRFRFARTA